MKIYHNPACSKSRATMEILKEKNAEFETILYLQNMFDLEKLKSLLSKLDITPIELIRTEQSLWKREFAGKEYTDDELLQLMLDNPKIIQRPIIEKGDEAVLGRPPENVLKFL